MVRHGTSTRRSVSHCGRVTSATSLTPIAAGTVSATRGAAPTVAAYQADQFSVLAVASSPCRMVQWCRAIVVLGVTRAGPRGLVEPGLKVEEVFKRVRVRVEEETGRTGTRQTPWESSSLRGDFYFVPPAEGDEEPGPVAGAGGTTPAADEAKNAYDTAVRENTIAAYRAVVEHFPGFYATLASRKMKELEATAAAEDRRARHRQEVADILAEAQQAAAGIEHGWDWWGGPRNRALAFAEIARVQAKFGDTRAAARSIGQARTNAYQEEAEDSRVRTLMDVIVFAQRKMGDREGAARTISEAWTITEGIDDDTDRRIAITTIAQAQAGLGQIENALATQQDGWHNFRHWAYVAIGESQVNAGAFEDALATVEERLGEDFYIDDRAGVFEAVIEQQAGAGDIPGALATARRLEQDMERVRARGKVTNPEEIGVFGPGGFAVLHRATALGMIAKAQLEAGDLRGGAATTQRIDDYRVWAQGFSDIEVAGVLASIAEAQAKAGDDSSAERTFSHALAVATGIDDEETWHSRACALAVVAASQARIGNHEEARQSFSDALTAAHEFQEEKDRDRVLECIAIEQAKSGEVQAAWATVGKVHYGNYLARAVGGIAEAQREAGDLDAALETARKIPTESSVRARTLVRIAEARFDALGESGGSELDGLGALSE